MSDEASLTDFTKSAEDPEEESREIIEIGEIQELDQSPVESWELVRLGQILDLEYGENLPSDTREEGDTPVFGSNGQVGYHSEPFVYDPGVILGRKGSIGEIEFSEQPFWPIDTTYYITQEETNENLRYLYYLLEHIQLDRLNAASAIPGLNRNDTYGLKALIPPIEEQLKIAGVLYTVDQGIQKTEEIIQQTRRVRKGFLQDLTSRGVDSDGTLRPAPDESPSLYIERDERTIPSSWEVIKLADVGDWMSGKTPKRSNGAYWEGSTPWVTAKDMKTLRVNDTVDHITEEAIEDGAAIAPPDAVLVLVRGMILDHTLPIVRPTKTVSFNQDVKAIVPDDGIDPDYLAYWLQIHSNEVLALVTAASHGTRRLATDTLGNLSVPIPPYEEQREIVERVRELDEILSVEDSYKEQLQRIKQGLMQDLLSGEVRTHDKDIDIPPEVTAHEPT